MEKILSFFFPQEKKKKFLHNLLFGKQAICGVHIQVRYLNSLGFFPLTLANFLSQGKILLIYVKLSHTQDSYSNKPPSPPQTFLLLLLFIFFFLLPIQAYSQICVLMCWGGKECFHPQGADVNFVNAKVPLYS